jgi:hypothetical protein
LCKLFFEKPQIKGGLNMFKENNPILSDEFLDEITKEINLQFGNQGQNDEVPTTESSI